MSTQPFVQVIDTVKSVLAGVSSEQLGEQSPCQQWLVSDVINHVINAQNFFLAGLTGTPPTVEVDHASDDYEAAFDTATGNLLAAFQADGALDGMVKMPFGEMPARGVLGLAMTDTFAHGWDIAKATGQSTDLNPPLAEALLQQSQAMIQPGFRGEDGKAPFGAEQEAPEGATAADRLAAFLGRTV